MILFLTLPFFLYQPKLGFSAVKDLPSLIGAPESRVWSGRCVRALRPDHRHLQSDGGPGQGRRQPEEGSVLNVRWWAAANATDAHRPLGPKHNLAATLCAVDTRQVNNDYTIQFRGQLYQIRTSAIPGRIAWRNGTGRKAARWRYLRAAPRTLPRRNQRGRTASATKAIGPNSHSRKIRRKHPGPSQAVRDSMDALSKQPAPPLWMATRDDRTRATDRLD
jgi:hypothetical protein